MARLSGSMWKSGDYKIHNGSIETIPIGWVLATELCDRAIVGAGGVYDNKQTFGTDSVRPEKPSVTVSVSNHTLSTARIPSHNHSLNRGRAFDNSSTSRNNIAQTGHGQNTNTSTVSNTINNSGSSQAHNHGASVSVGNVGTVDTRQKSIALIWIRKL